MDDNSKFFGNSNPRETASTLSIILWWWTMDIFKKGYRKVLGLEDLYEPLKSDRSDALGDRLERRWNTELQNAKKGKHPPNLLRAIFRTFLPESLFLGCIQVINEFFIRLGTPILLGGLLRYFNPKPLTTYESALMYAAGIAATTGLSALFINQIIFTAFHVGGKIRIAVCSVVYRKALRLSMTALGETAPGKVVNLVANDVNRFDLIMVFIHHMWTAPLQVIIIGYFMYTQIGYAGLFGILAVLTVVPIQSYTGKLSSKFRLQTAIKTDERVRLMDEIISGVQVIKMYAWEKPFCALIEQARKLELKVVKKSAYIRGIYMTFNLFTTRMALYCTILAMLMGQEQLTADKIFVISAYFNILANTMSGMFVRGFAEIAECIVVVRRLQTFLSYEEFQSGNVTNDDSSSKLNGSISCDIKKEPDFPYIDEDVSYDERTSDENRQSFGLANDMLKKNLSEVNSKHIGNHKSTQDDAWAVNLHHVTVKWDLHSSEAPTLEKVNLKIEKGKLYVVIGMVGTGKSTLLSTILGEINVLQGNVKVNGSISYAGQESWVFGSSVRRNILFGLEFDRQRYQKVVKACALLQDFKQFPHGDQTIVGERGSSLSGGQKARINLARAVYRQANIYLLDDPLSAVDAHVSKHLFDECLQKYLGGTTRILATHQLQYIKYADSIILVDQNKLKQFKDYRELLQTYPQYNKLVSEERLTDSSDSSFEKSYMKRQFSSSSTRSRTPEIVGDTDGVEEKENNVDQGHGFIEGTSRGTVKGSILLKYYKVGSSLFSGVAVLFLGIVTQIIISLNDMFIPVIVTAEESRSFYKNLHESEMNDSSTLNITSSETMILDEEDILPRDTYVYIYSVIVVLIFVVGIIRSFVLYDICVRCSQRLHDLMFGSLIRTTMRFFDTNPSGRILNRFSKDMGAIDELLPKAMLDAGQIILCMIGSLIVACTVNPIFLLPVSIIMLIFYWIKKIYLKTSKNVKRLEGMTRSPVFTHLNATLNGLSTVRAFHAQDILKKEFDKFQDIHTSSWFIFVAASTAFGFSLDVFCFLFTALVTFSFLIFAESQPSGGQVGLAITQVMMLTGMVQWGMRQSAEISNQLMSVERVLEYTQLPCEPNLRDKGILTKKKKKKAQQTEEKLIEVSHDWPSDGCIEFKAVYMRYTDEDPPVLKGLTLKIRPGEKMGIVGRTGAGKSSLISALFRLANVEGIVEIDGVDTRSIALEDLRKHISIIPQDPVLFSGTLRRNLDPFNEFKDQTLWKVLEEVEIKDAVTATGNGLDNKVMDRGANYSVGQRQLICLARAILRNNKILMLDEATANVDPHTDALIQRTIRTKFSECTVLTVAHRLNTIMDSDKVLVMDRGRLVEYDHPHILLQNEYGPFSQLVKETGKAMYEQFCKIAGDSYASKRVDCTPQE